MSWGDAELLLIALAAMLSPTTLSFSVLALVLGERPLRTGVWFYLGALSAMLAIGVAAAFVLGNVAASPTSTPKTWVAIVDVIAGALLLVYVVRLVRRPADPAKAAGMVARMGKVASSPAVAIFGAGAVLANAGGFIPSPSRRYRRRTRAPRPTSATGSPSRSCPCFRSESRS